MFQKLLQILKFCHSGEQFLEVFQAGGGIGCFGLLPHGGVTRVFQNHFGQCHMILGFGHLSPMIHLIQKGPQFLAGGGAQLIALQHLLPCTGQAEVLRPRIDG